MELLGRMLESLFASQAAEIKSSIRERRCISRARTIDCHSTAGTGSLGRNSPGLLHDRQVLFPSWDFRGVSDFLVSSQPDDFRHHTQSDLRKCFTSELKSRRTFYSVEVLRRNSSILNVLEERFC